MSNASRGRSREKKCPECKKWHLKMPKQSQNAKKCKKNGKTYQQKTHK
jgi:hypothetical protein